MMLNPDGTYAITADEVATLVAGHEFWWMLADGTTTTTSERTPPAADAIYLMTSSQRWVDQWDGDFQRACDEVLNPALRANAHLMSEESPSND